MDARGGTSGEPGLAIGALAVTPHHAYRQVMACFQGPAGHPFRYAWQMNTLKRFEPEEAFGDRGGVLEPAVS
jgi:hypothetical protein